MPKMIFTLAEITNNIVQSILQARPAWLAPPTYCSSRLEEGTSRHQLGQALYHIFLARMGANFNAHLALLQPLKANMALLLDLTITFRYYYFSLRLFWKLLLTFDLIDCADG